MPLTEYVKIANDNRELNSKLKTAGNKGNQCKKSLKPKTKTFSVENDLKKAF